MLQLLVCSDVHTFTENIRLAVRQLDRTDAILIAGDLEAEQDAVNAAAGEIPFYAVSGNNDYYLNTEYPEELLIDIASPSPITSPEIVSVTRLKYESLPEKYLNLPVFMRKPLFSHFSLRIAAQKRPPEISWRILMTHGKEYNVPEKSLLLQRAALWDADLVIFGHTHRFYTDCNEDSRNRKCFLLNPGCLMGDPRSQTRVYATYEICSFAVLRIGFEREISVQHLYL